MPEVTVVICHYSAWQYLPKAIAAAKAQTVPVEIIVIDDCSPQWRVYLQELPADLLDGVTFVHPPQKLHWAATLNLGFTYAQTPWVVPLNGDDLIDPTIVEKCLAKARIGDDIVFPGGSVLGLGILEDNYLPYCAMIRKEAWEAIGGYDLVSQLCDWDFWVKAYRANCASSCTGECLFTWVDRPGNMSSIYGSKLVEMVAEFKRNLK